MCENQFNETMKVDSNFHFQFNREKTKTTKSATLHNSTEAITVKQEQKNNTFCQKLGSVDY